MRCDKVTWHACAKRQSSSRDKGTSHWYVATDNGLNLLKVCEPIHKSVRVREKMWNEQNFLTPETNSGFGQKQAQEIGQTT